LRYATHAKDNVAAFCDNPGVKRPASPNFQGREQKKA